MRRWPVRHTSVSRSSGCAATSPDRPWRWNGRARTGQGRWSRSICRSVRTAAAGDTRITKKRGRRKSRIHKRPCLTMPSRCLPRIGRFTASRVDPTEVYECRRYRDAYTRTHLRSDSIAIKADSETSPLKKMAIMGPSAAMCFLTEVIESTRPVAASSRSRGRAALGAQAERFRHQMGTAP